MSDLVVAVLLNYNQNDYTIKCVESLLESSYSNLKIIVVDNGSTSSNVQMLEQNLPRHEKVLFKRIEDNIGYARGTNFGLKEGVSLSPDYFLILNNDTIIDRLAIESMVKTCKEYDNLALVTGKVYDFEKPDMLQQVGAEIVIKSRLKYRKLGLNEIDQGQFDKVEERDMIDDVFVLHPISLYEKLQGYSPYFWINGVNADSAFRAMKEGYKLIFTPEAKIWHKGSASIGGRDMNPKLAYWGVQSTLMLRYLYLTRYNFFVFYLKTIENILRTFVKSIYLKVFKGIDIRDYSKAKYKGLLYFNKWVFKKQENSGYNPY